MNTWIEIKTVGIIAIMLLIPGWSFLSITRIWEYWKTLQRWFLALGIGIAFYPILFYFARAILPSFRIGDRKLWVMLLTMLIFTLWFMKKSWKEQFLFDKGDGLILAVLGATLFTRLWLAHLYPYPAWTDSLHHTLLTNLVAEKGVLPYTLAPYAHTSLAQYHLGLYSLTGSLQTLANIPAHSALLWMSQTLNGLCVLGLFLFLDRKVSRLAALVGMVVVGLLSFQPAWYFNWGRFTQISSQSLFLLSAVITWETLNTWQNLWPTHKRKILLLTFLAGYLNAAVFLLHYRVAGYLFPLLVIICLYESFKQLKEKNKLLQTTMGMVLLGVVSFCLIIPALIPAFEVYYSKRVVALENPTSAGVRLPSENPYYSTYNLDTIWSLSARKWLAGLSVSGAIVSLFGKKRQLSLITLMWLLALVLEGFAYKLNIPILAFTNMTGMMIMLYMPIGIFVGVLAYTINTWLPTAIQLKIEPFFLWLLLFSGFIGAFYRVADVENYRQMMTVQDQAAMEWIKENTPRNAVFAIHTYFWLPKSPQGSEAGYWIPYFAERKTTADTMITSLGPKNTISIDRSEIVMSLYTDHPSIDALCKLGVNYLYDGSKDSFEYKDFNIEKILSFPGVKLVYDNNNILIIKLCK